MTSMTWSKSNRESETKIALARCYCLLFKASKSKVRSHSVDSESIKAATSPIGEVEVTDKNNEYEMLSE